MTYSFTLAQLATAYETMPPEIKDPFIIWNAGLEDLQDDETVLNMIEYYLSEAKDSFWAELAARDFVYDKAAATITLLSPDALTAAAQVSAEIGYEYDATKREGMPSDWWETLGLGGDDDVDYHDGYLDVIYFLLDCLVPDGWGLRPTSVTREDYHLPADVLEAQTAAYMADFYEKYPERKVLDDLRAAAHTRVKAYFAEHLPDYRLPGLTLSAQGFDLYTQPGADSDECIVYHCVGCAFPLTFVCNGFDDIVIL